MRQEFGNVLLDEVTQFRLMVEHNTERDCGHHFRPLELVALDDNDVVTALVCDVGDNP